MELFAYLRVTSSYNMLYHEQQEITLHRNLLLWS